MQWGNRPQEPSCALQFWIQKMAKIVYSEEKEQKIKLGKDRWRVVNSGDRSRFACSMRQGNWGQKVKATALTWKSKKEQKGRGAQKEQGRRDTAAARVLRWGISEAGIHLFPGTAEFGHSQELKKPLLQRNLDCVGGWINTLGVLLSVLSSLSWGRRCESNWCP